VGQKEKRIIDTLEPVMAQHRLIVDRDLIQRDYDSVAHLPVDEAFQYRLFYQMTRITRDRKSVPHDDRIEAVAGAVTTSLSRWLVTWTRQPSLPGRRSGKKRSNATSPTKPSDRRGSPRKRGGSGLDR
jgi:hypothetical protein